MTKHQSDLSSGTNPKSDYETYVTQVWHDEEGQRRAERMPLQVPWAAAIGDFDKLSKLQRREMVNDLRAELERRETAREPRNDDRIGYARLADSINNLQGANGPDVRETNQKTFDLLELAKQFHLALRGAKTKAGVGYQIVNIEATRRAFAQIVELMADIEEDAVPFEPSFGGGHGDERA
jgi:hypothetical protein